MTYRCIIIDDEEPARELISTFISKIPFLEEAGKFKGPISAMSILHSEKIDILFLDIQMPELTGIEFLKSMDVKPHVIFTTAYKEHALEGYQLNIVDYLLKPFTFERFLQAVTKTVKLIKLHENESVQNVIPESYPVPENSTQEFFTVQSNHKLYNIRYKDILFIEGLGEYITYYLSSGKKVVVLESLKNLEISLPEDFIRVHRSYIIPSSKVDELEGNMLVIGDKKIPIGRSYKKEVMERVFGR